ncbi:hypothetical protein YW7DRAFT_00767 [Streptomyces sp. AmelKG-E11A]|nr:hypothetical protein YW7DRAFT_00767 [Streptomyces sp. AmelKG-E11A]
MAGTGGDGLIACVTAVGGSPLPPDISAVGASGRTDGGFSPATGAANTVSGSGTEPSAPRPAVSVPAHGVGSPVTGSRAVGSRTSSDAAPGHAPAGSPVPPPGPAVVLGDSTGPGNVSAGPSAPP